MSQQNKFYQQQNQNLNFLEPQILNQNSILDSFGDIELESQTRVKIGPRTSKSQHQKSAFSFAHAPQPQTLMPQTLNVQQNIQNVHQHTYSSGDFNQPPLQCPLTQPLQTNHAQTKPKHIQILKQQLTELQQAKQTHKTLETQLSKFKKLVEQKQLLLKQMEKEVKVREKVNEKRAKAYEEVVKVKVKQAEEKVRAKKQQFRLKLETYEKRKALVQADSERLVILERELRAKKDQYESQLDQFEQAKSQFEQEKQQFTDLQNKKEYKIDKEITQAKHSLHKIGEKILQLEQKLQQLNFKEKNLDLNDQDLKDLERKLGSELSKVTQAKNDLLSQEKELKNQLNQLQSSKEIEILASEELKKTEIILFDKENREYEADQQHKQNKSQILHLKRIIAEKANQLGCLRDQVTQKEAQLNDEEELLLRNEQELEEDLSCTQYCVSELKKKLRDLEQKREEAKKRETIVKERLKIEGKIELELAGLEFNQDRWVQHRELQQKQLDMDLRVLKERENTLRAKENDLKKKENIASRSHVSSSLMFGGGDIKVFKDVDQHSEFSLGWENKENLSLINKIF